MCKRKGGKQANEAALLLLRHRWDAEDKRAGVAALVQAVYVAEKDRQAGRQGVYELAPRWWEGLGYERERWVMGEGEEGSEQIIGAVFRRRVEEGSGEEAAAAAAAARPAMVVALRGTMPQGEALLSDLVADGYLVLQRLHSTSRFTAALQATRLAIASSAATLCLAGHSLGAALALLAARTLAPLSLDTHLFNPPFPSPPLPLSRPRWLLALHLLRITSLAALSPYLLHPQTIQAASLSFLALQHWSPHLYLNPNDPFCSSYIGYFATRDFVQSIGAGALAQRSAPLSLRGTIQEYLFGHLLGECKALHLIPCASLHVVEKSSRKLVKAHGLHQWWSPALPIRHWQVNFSANQHAEGVEKDQPT